MDAFETYRELDNALAEAADALSQMRSDGQRKAKAEADYRAAKATATLKARMEGVPVTIIKDVLFEDPALCAFRYERDVAETLYDASREQVMLLKLRINVLRDRMEQISRAS